MRGLPACMSVNQCMPGAHRGQNRASDSLGTGKRLWITKWVLGLELSSLKKQPVLLTMEPLSNPYSQSLKMFISLVFALYQYLQRSVSK